MNSPPPPVTQVAAVRGLDVDYDTDRSSSSFTSYLYSSQEEEEDEEGEGGRYHMSEGTDGDDDSTSQSSSRRVNMTMIECLRLSKAYDCRQETIAASSSTHPTEGRKKVITASCPACMGVNTMRQWFK
jgi:hypothetical protein